MTTAAVEDSLAVAFRLQEEEAPVTVAALAQRLSLSHASVSLMVKRLVQEELLERDEGEVRPRGRRGRGGGGGAGDGVHDEAGRWEHVLSPAVEERLDGVVGRPDSCPHGHPIPGRGADMLP